MLKLLTVKPKTKAAYQAYVDALTEDREKILKIANNSDRDKTKRLSEYVYIRDAGLVTSKVSFWCYNPETHYKTILLPTLAYYCPTAVQEVFGDNIDVIYPVIREIMCSPYWFHLQFYVFHWTNQYHPELFRDVDYYGKSTVDMHQGWYPKHNFDHFFGLNNAKLLRIETTDRGFLLGIGAYIGRLFSSSYDKKSEFYDAKKSERIEPDQIVEVTKHDYVVSDRGNAAFIFTFNDKETGEMLGTAILSCHSPIFAIPLSYIEPLILSEDFQVLEAIINYVHRYLWEQVTSFIFAKNWFEMTSWPEVYRFFSSAQHEEKILDLAHIEPDIDFKQTALDANTVKKSVGTYRGIVIDDRIKAFYRNYIVFITQGRSITVATALAYFPTKELFEYILARSFPNYLSAQNHEGLEPMIHLVGTPNREEELLYENDLLYFNEVKYEKPTLVQVI